MPTLVPFVALLASGCALSGALLAWIALERRHLTRHAASGFEQTRRARARYAAYQDLQCHLTQAVTGFERRERELLRALATQKENLAELLAALDARQVQSDEVSPDEAVRWMEQVFEPRRAAVAERDELAAELAGWEQRLQHAQDEKRAELGRQSTLIQESTDRVRHLEPAAAAGNAQQEAQGSATIARLQQELEHALEIAGRASLAEASRAAAVGEQAALRAQLSVLGSEGERIAELCRERDEAVGALEARTAEIVRLRNGSSQPEPSGAGHDAPRIEQELERLRSEASGALEARTEREAHFAQQEAHLERELEHARSELDDLADSLVRTEAKSATSAQERGALVAERDALVEDLELERTSLEDSQRRLQEALDRIESSDQALEQELRARKSELDRAQGELQESREREQDARSSEAGRKEREAEESETLRAECRAAVHESARMTGALAEVQGELQELRAEHRGVLTTREKELGQLQSSLADLERGTDARLERESRALARREAQLAKGASKLERGRAAHDERAARRTEELKTLRAERRAARTEAKRATVVLAERKMELQALEEQLVDAERVGTRLAKDSQKSQDRLERELAKSEGKLQKLEERLAKQIETGRAKSQELAARKQAVRELKEQGKGLARDLKDATKQLGARQKASSGQKAQIGDLLRALDRARDEAASTSGKLARKGSQVEAAHDMLSSLLPMLEALGGQLDDAR